MGTDLSFFSKRRTPLSFWIRTLVTFQPESHVAASFQVTSQLTAHSLQLAAHDIPPLSEVGVDVVGAVCDLLH